MDSDINALNLGSKTATESSAAGMPDPRGFSASMPQMQQQPIELGPEVKAPASYRPGQTSAAGMQMEESSFNKVGNFLIDLGTQPGEIPTSIKMKLAQHKSMLDESQDKLAWANYHDTHVSIQAALQKQNQNSIINGLEFLSNVKGAMAQMTPEERTQAIPQFSKMLGHFNPEFAGIPQLFHDNPSGVLGLDSAAGQYPEVKKAFLGRPAAQVYADPQWQAFAVMYGKDVTNLINTRIPEAKKKEIREGKVNQQQYEELHKAAMFDASFPNGKPVDHAFASHFLNTPHGEAMMQGLGVQTDQMVVNKNKKEKPDNQTSVIDQDKQKNYTASKEILADAQANPDKYSTGFIKKHQDQVDTYLGLRQKQSAPTESKNTDFVHNLGIESGGKYTSADEVYALPEGPEKKQALQWVANAQKRKEQASAKSQMTAKMSAPHDMNAQPVYQLDKEGNPTRVTEQLSQGEYLTGKHGFTMTHAQEDKFNSISYAESEGKRLMDLSDEAFKGTTIPQRADQVQKEWRVKNGLGFSLGPEDDKLSEYVQERGALLGKFSKSLGGEVGVLTDQDIARVVNMFPTGHDTPGIRAAKKKAFLQIIKFNKDALTKFLAVNKGTANEGNVTPAQIAQAKADPKMRAYVNGVLGSVEGESAKAQKELGGTPQETPKSTSLFQKMGAEVK